MTEIAIVIGEQIGVVAVIGDRVAIHSVRLRHRIGVVVAAAEDSIVEEVIVGVAVVEEVAIEI